MKESYLYIIGVEDKSQLKIGFSNNPEKRLKTLSTARPDTLILHFKSEPVATSRVRMIEKIIHHKLSCKIKREWYSMNYEDIVTKIKFCIMTYDNSDAALLYRHGALRY